MCGIAAIFANGSEHIVLQHGVRTILDKLRHRGYSHCEIDTGAGWAMGTNRLPIVGRDSGHQPCYSADGQILGVLNGEIYNYRELRRILQWSGYSFKTDTDTEVMVNAFHRWGAAAFQMFDGMFAAILYDKGKAQHVVARDPLGIKPLYYCEHDGIRHYASEIKALVHLDQTVHEFPPGSFSVQGQVEQSCFQTMPEALPGNFQDCARRLKAHLSQAVRKRVQTRLPIAVFLSGGIDSGAILYEAVRHHDNVTAFTIGLDEAPDVLGAKALCETLNVPLVHVTTSEEQLLELVPEVISTIESFEPNHIRGGALSWLLAREVQKQGFRIALCGEGADELFGGYDEFVLRLESPGGREQLPALFDTFIHQLHRTQLQRVDRTSMRFTIETRVPFLDRRILDFVAALPMDYRLRHSADGVVTKAILRQAYRGILPDETVERQKIVLSLGAGYGSNGPEGVFYQQGEKLMEQDEFERWRQAYPQYHLRSREEAWYFSLFIRQFHHARFAAHRPTVNTTGEHAHAA